MTSLVSRATAFFVLAAALVRIVKVFLITVVARDSVVYVKQISAFFQGDGNAGLSAYYPPLYALISALFALLFSPHGGGVCVSVLSGTLLVLPFRRYAQSHLDPSSLFYASLFLVFTPSLILYSAEILAESFFLFLFMSLLATLQEQSKTRPLGLAFLSGAISGALTLTRPEGIAAVLGAALLCARRGPEDKGRSFKQRGAAFALSLVAAVLVLAPYSYYLNQESGHWTFTKKEGTVIGGLAKYSESKQTPIPEVHEHFRKSNDGHKRSAPPQSAASELSSILSGKPLLFLKKCLHGLGQCFLLVPRASHWLLFLLALPGLTVLAKSKKWPWELTLILALHLLVVSTVTPQKRYLLPEVLLVVLGAGRGFAFLVETLRLGKRSRWALTFAVLVILGITAFKQERRRKEGIHTLAAVLKQEAGSVKVASIESRVAYYGEVDDQQLPRCANLEELKNFLAAQSITHLCIRENWRVRWCPWLNVEDIGELIQSVPEGRTELLLIRVKTKN